MGWGFGSVVSSAFDVAKDFGMAAYTDYRSRKAASTSRDWQEYMSNTAHQREVADLRKAGLNPILSATGGPGASTPGGAMARVPDYDSKTSAYQNYIQNKLSKASVWKMNKEAFRDSTQGHVNQAIANYLVPNQALSFQTSAQLNQALLKGAELDNINKAYTAKALDNLGGLQKYGPVGKFGLDLLRLFMQK